MKAAEKRKLEDLERRVRELEARPVVYPTIVILQPAAPPAPYIGPWNPVQPFIIYSPDGRQAGLGTFTG